MEVHHFKNEMIFEQSCRSAILQNTHYRRATGRTFDQVFLDVVSENHKVRGAYTRARGRERAGRHYKEFGKAPFWLTSSSVDQKGPAPRHKPKSEQDPDFVRRMRKANQQKRANIRVLTGQVTRSAGTAISVPSSTKDMEDRMSKLSYGRTMKTT